MDPIHRNKTNCKKVYYVKNSNFFIQLHVSQLQCDLRSYVNLWNKEYPFSSLSSMTSNIVVHLSITS